VPFLSDEASSSDGLPAQSPTQPPVTPPSSPAITPVPTPVGIIASLTYHQQTEPPIPVILTAVGGEAMSLRQATPVELQLGENAFALEADASVVARDARDLIVTWIGTACERGYTLTVAAGLSGVAITPAPRPGCDTGRVTFAVVLTFPSTVEPRTIALSLRRPVITDG